MLKPTTAMLNLLVACVNALQCEWGITLRTDALADSVLVWISELCRRPRCVFGTVYATRDVSAGSHSAIVSSCVSVNMTPAHSATGSGPFPNVTKVNWMSRSWTAAAPPACRRLQPESGRRVGPLSHHCLRRGQW